MSLSSNGFGTNDQVDGQSQPQISQSQDDKGQARQNRLDGARQFGGQGQNPGGRGEEVRLNLGQVDARINQLLKGPAVQRSPGVGDDDRVIQAGLDQLFAQVVGILQDHVGTDAHFFDLIGG